LHDHVAHPSDVRPSGIASCLYVFDTAKSFITGSSICPHLASLRDMILLAAERSIVAADPKLQGWLANDGHDTRVGPALSVPAGPFFLGENFCIAKITADRRYQFAALFLEE
jgi:hypothetical protein